MSILERKIKFILDNKGLSINKLALSFGLKSSGNLNQMISGKKSFSEKLIKKMLPILEVSREEFESWILADKYSKEIIERAIQVKKEFPYKRKSILTTKIDAILQEMGLSRRAFAKQVIDYEQSSFNQIVVRKRNMSDSVLEKVSTAFGIPQEEILSWIVADRYNLRLLELALL